MSMMGILDIGSNALSAQRTALEVTGENVTNINTPGYSRQTVVLETSPGSVDGQLPVGSGVRVASIQRAHDAFLQAQIQGESSASGKDTVLNSAMQNIEPLFNDTAVVGIATSLQNFFNSWQNLAVNPQGTTERQAVLSNAETLTSDIQRVSGSLNDIRLGANKSLTGITSDISDKLKQIADLNGQVQAFEVGGASANQLRDSRDKLLQELSLKVGVTSREESNGMVTVTLGSTSTSAGAMLVEGTKASLLTVDGNYGNIVLKRTASDAGIDVTPAITADPKSGELGGTLQVRDKVVPGFLGKLDEFAYTLATQVNSAHRTGYNLNNATGVDFFTAAASSSGYSSSIALNVKSTNEIAAALSASNDITVTGTGNNQNALAIAALENSSFTVSGSQTTIPGLYSTLVGNVGSAVQSSQQGVTQSDAMLKQLGTLRESVAGVNLDEELTKLLSFQKAYEASAKMVATGQTMLDTLLNMVR